MRLLLDTHIAVWAALQPDVLTAAERKTMSAVDTPLAISAVSIWELRLKWNSVHVSGSRKGPVGPDTIIEMAASLDWDVMPLSARDAAAVLSHPLTHKDPFDELLLIQAQEHGLRLLTRDARLAGHPFAADASH